LGRPDWFFGKSVFGKGTASAVPLGLANERGLSGTSVGANYRAAGRARSAAEFSAKIGIVLEEVDETT